MSIDLYQASVPQFLRMLGNLKAILEKAAAHAAAKKIDESALLNARLFPDMFPLTRPGADRERFRARHERPAVRRRAARGRGQGEELRRIDRPGRRRDRLRARSLRRRSSKARKTREIKRKIRGVERTFSGIDYLYQFALPNFYFHLTTAYAILRHNGVEVGKSDFLGTFG